MIAKFRHTIAYQAGLLGIVTSLSTILLVAGNAATKDAIHQRGLEDLQASFSEVLPAGSYDNKLVETPLQLAGDDGKPVTVYRGTLAGQISALVWEITGPGYAGNIRLLMGIKPDGEILGVRVLAHTETPGLGDKIEAAKDDWIRQFSGLSLGNPPLEKWKVKKDGGQFDSFSGATITPRGVVKAIENGLLFFQARRAELLKP